MELVKDYDYTIQYYPSKANAVTNALSKKCSKSLAHIWVEKKELIKDLHEMGAHGTQLDLHDSRFLLSNIQVQSPLVKKITLIQAQDPQLEKWMLAQNENFGFKVDQDGILKC